MSSKSKIKGSAFERETVDCFKASGFEAVRAWGSNGKSLGEADNVDVVVRHRGAKYTYQLKRRKKLPDFLIDDSVTGVITREDNGQTKVIIPLSDYMRLLDGNSRENTSAEARRSETEPHHPSGVEG